MATQLTLNAAQIKQLATFLKTYNVGHVFLAKDEGAYFGANAQVGDKMQSCIFYFRGCDPQRDVDWYDNAHAKFGGDDFGEVFDAACVREAESKGAARLVLRVSAQTLSMTMYK